ncbi:MAG TPA: hypothetical protein VMW91_09730 [Desulfosporosinus sp.]|nr:hypothetical protein [Desulfosporosinus sp.]
MSDCKCTAKVDELIKKHREDVQRQNEVYQKNIQSRIRPAGAGLDSDDLSKVAGTDVIGKGGGEEDLRK